MGNPKELDGCHGKSYSKMDDLETSNIMLVNPADLVPIYDIYPVNHPIFSTPTTKETSI